MEFSWETIIISSLIIFFAFYTRTLLGFGGALISIPLLAFFLPLKVAVPLEAMFEVVLSFILLRSEWKNINFVLLRPVLIGGIIGTLLGTHFLVSFANEVLLKALGVFIIVFALNLLRKRTVEVKTLPKPLGLIAGTFGGVLGAMFGTSGPPYILYLAYQINSRKILRATLIGLFAFDTTFRLGYFALSGLITQDVLGFAVLLIPALLIGIILGRKHVTVLGEEAYRKGVVILLIIAGLLQIIK